MIIKTNDYNELFEIYNKGYDPNALGIYLPIPELPPELYKLALNGGEIFNYVHHSVIMHALRKMAIVTAHYIRGDCYHRLDRPPQSAWKICLRVGKANQITWWFYKNNEIDMSHLVRRADVTFGATVEEAMAAQLATFMFPNIVGMFHLFNCGKWYRAEEKTLNLALDYKMAVSVFNGPIFKPDDILYRDVLMPRTFFKIVVTRHPQTKNLKATAYMMMQTDDGTDKDIPPGDLPLYEVSIPQIEEQTGLRFKIPTAAMSIRAHVMRQITDDSQIILMAA